MTAVEGRRTALSPQNEVFSNDWLKNSWIAPTLWPAWQTERAFPLVAPDETDSHCSRFFKLFIESGLVDISKDPTIIAHLEDVNQELVPYNIEGTGYDLKDVDYGWVKD